MNTIILLTIISAVIGSAVILLNLYTKKRTKKEKYTYMLRYLFAMTVLMMSLGLLQRFSAKESFERYKEVEVLRYYTKSDPAFIPIGEYIYTIVFDYSDGVFEKQCELINVEQGYHDKFEALIIGSGNRLVLYRYGDDDKMFPVMSAQDSLNEAKKVYYSIFPKEMPSYRAHKYFVLTGVFGVLFLIKLIMSRFVVQPEIERQPVVSIESELKKFYPEISDNIEMLEQSIHRRYAVEEYEQHSGDDINEDENEPFVVYDAEDIFHPSLRSQEEIVDARDEVLIRKAKRSKKKKEIEF